MKLLKNTSTPLITTLLFLLASSLHIINVNADELTVPVGHQGAEKTSLERPKVGMTSTAVETRFGAPLKKTTPVGKPPISSWEYPYYNVYFESDHVIHSVLKPFSDEVPAPAAEQPPVTEATPAPVIEPAPVAEPVPAQTPAAEATEATK